jgi:hypothetical protein
MRVRIHIILDKDISEQEAHERYGTVDRYSVVQAMQAEADRELTPELVREKDLACASVRVDLLGW